MTDDEATRARCEVDTSGERDAPRYCGRMAWMLDAGRRQFRAVSSLMHGHNNETRDGVVVDLGGDLWAECRFCPFCGASIETRFRRPIAEAEGPPAEAKPALQETLAGVL